MSFEESEDAINRLVETRYPYQVADILAGIPHQSDRAVVVAAALYRSVEKGRIAGREEARGDLRARLGL